MTSVPAPKVCIKCGTDCTGKPRTKDPTGRYTCRPCFEATAKAPPPAPPVAEDDALPIGLVEDAVPILTVGLQTCPSCQSSVPHGSAICVQCGYDLIKGKAIKIDTSIPKEESAVPAREGKCGKCGYSIKGLKAPRCPECGTLIGRLTDRERRDRENAQTVKWAYLKPLIHLAIGLLGAGIFYGAMGEPELIGFHVFRYVITVPIGVIIFLACCYLWIGFDAPVHLLCLRLAGVYALVDLSAIFASFIPVWPVQAAIVTFAYIGLLAESLDLDIQDAVIVGIITSGAKVVIGFALIAATMANH